MKDGIELCNEALSQLDSTGYAFFVVLDARDILRGEECSYTTEKIIQQLRDSVDCRSVKVWDTGPMILEIADILEKRNGDKRGNSKS